MSDRIAAARERLEAFARAEREDPTIHPERGTRWYVPDEVAERAVLLVHGFTNSPPQYDALLRALSARGHAVVVPRFPYHSYRDRMTTAIERLRAHHLTGAALDGLAIAALCGRRVVVLGISVGATIAGWLAARVAVDHAIAVAPFCGVHSVPGPLNDPAGAALRALPNRFLWWDPRRKQAQAPEHGYPQFPTRGLGESLGIATDLIPLERNGEHARRCSLVFNLHEPAVNDAHARRRFAGLRALGVALDEITLPNLPHIHDIVEPAIPEARIDLVYPTLIRLIEAE